MRAEYIDGKVVAVLDGDLVDELAVAVLKEGRKTAADNLVGVSQRISEFGPAPARISDLADGARYVAAFDALLEYYGANND